MRSLHVVVEGATLVVVEGATLVVVEGATLVEGTVISEERERLLLSSTIACGLGASIRSSTDSTDAARSTPGSGSDNVVTGATTARVAPTVTVATAADPEAVRQAREWGSRESGDARATQRPDNPSELADGNAKERSYERGVELRAGIAYELGRACSSGRGFFRSGWPS